MTYKLKPKILFPLLIVVAIIVVAATLFWLGQEPPEQPVEAPSDEVTEELKPAEKELPPGRVGPLGQGKQTYTIISDKPKNPQIIEAAFNPLDVKAGKSQIITVKVLDTDNNPITSENAVSATYYTDSGSSTILLSLRRADGPDLVTTWEGIWECEDSHDFVYQAVIKATNTANESSVTLSFR